MSLPIRAAILEYQRDSYLNHKSSQAAGSQIADDRPSSDRPSMIDCAVAYSQWGVSSRVGHTLASFDVNELCHYPEQTHDRVLKPRILERYSARGIGPDGLFLGHGCFNLVERVIHKLIRPEVMIGIGPQFNEIPSEFQAAGGTYVPIPIDVDRSALPVAALEAAIAQSPASMLYIDHPNNPLGLAADLADLQSLAGACARHGAVMVVDEAYGDFLEDCDSAVHLVGDHDNMVVVRSFSKALGLAAERVGYMFISDRLAAFYRQIDVPFEPTHLGALLASETLQDPDFIAHVRSEAGSAKARIVSAVASADVEVLPTHDAVAILALRAAGRDIVAELEERGVAVLAGSSFNRTEPRWDDSCCRLRIVNRDLVPQLCERLATL